MAIFEENSNIHNRNNNNIDNCNNNGGNNNNNSAVLQKTNTDVDYDSPSKCVVTPSFLSPLGTQMKKLKKIKKKIAIFGNRSSSRLDSPCPNNLPPLLFHAVHGDNIVLLNGGRVARRRESFCKGIVFTNRPVKVNEKISIRLNEFANTWTGFLRFGFTSRDPATLGDRLPKYACPDLTRLPDFWAKAVSDSYFQPNMVLEFYVNSAGEVKYSINDIDLGLFISNVNVRVSVWAMVDLYGNSTAIELIDPRHSLNNNVRANYDVTDNNSNHNGSNGIDCTADNSNANCLINGRSSNRNRHDEAIPSTRSLSARQDGIARFSPLVEIDRHSVDFPRRPIIVICGNTTGINDDNYRNSNQADSSANTNNNVNHNDNQDISVASNNVGQNLRRNSSPLAASEFQNYNPVTFNSRVHGCNVRFSPDKLLATRGDSEFCNGCVFLSQPFNFNECVAIQILGTDESYLGGLGFGLTSCNPENLNSSDLPDEIMDFLDRQEYWVLEKDLSNSPLIVDEILFFWLNSDGDVMIRRNNGPPRFLFHVDTSQTLWPFFDVYGTTVKIRAFVATYNNRTVVGNQRRRNTYLDITTRTTEQPPFACLPHYVDDLHLQPRFMLDISPYVMALNEHSSQQEWTNRSRISYEELPYDPNYGRPGDQSVSVPSARRSIVPRCIPLSTSSSDKMNAEQKIPLNLSTTITTTQTTGTTNCGSSGGAGGDENDNCYICFERPIDTALYNCGHLCLCLECAYKLWRDGDGHCPLCRAVIRDVVRIYRP